MPYSNGSDSARLIKRLNPDRELPYCQTLFRSVYCLHRIIASDYILRRRFMAVRIITDRTCDIPPELEKELNIINIPVYLVFGKTSFRDGVDITTDQFYQKLLHEPVYPTTSQPTPKDFADVFNNLSQEADGILAIHISKKLSGTINSAEQAVKMVTTKGPIEIIDSLSVSLGVGLQVIAAARMAKQGKKLAEISAAVKSMVPNTKVFILFDTLEYLAKGGRIGKAKSLMGAILNVKPTLYSP
ncbi:MAG: DegV family protein [Dehalococcoidia bacterium]|nr:MAG: DegV family protein [Dehalococcoidia bacterium]